MIYDCSDTRGGDRKVGVTIVQLYPTQTTDIQNNVSDMKNVNKLKINLCLSLFEINPQHTTTNLKHTGHFLLSSDAGYHHIFTVRF